MFPKTSGWLREGNRSAHVLRATDVKYLKAYVVNSPSSNDVSVVTSIANHGVDQLCLTRRIGDKITDGSVVTVYLYEV